MKLDEIIALADKYVPNSGFTPADKVKWITEINNNFFEVVKIAQVYPFNAVKNTADYTLPATIDLRNIDRIIVGTSTYESLQLTEVPPGQNGWTYDEATRKLTLLPAPAYDAPSYVRYAKKGTAAFVDTLLTASPEAPDPYHHLYALGLAEFMALAMDDVVKAQNYGQQYRSQLTIAQANYQRGG